MTNDNNDWPDNTPQNPAPQDDDWGQPAQPSSAGGDSWDAPPQGQQSPMGPPPAQTGAQPQGQPGANLGQGPGAGPQGQQQPPQANQQPGQGQQPVQQPGGQMTKSKKKFPELEGGDFAVLLLSFFLPGSGHIMLGQTLKGAVILGIVIFTCGAGYIMNLLIVADAFFCLAKKKEHGALEDWEFFPNYNDYI